ncbi:hypothetical protein [Diaminobutyricimonas sp. TR449]|uniref:hypothetical protein n=1 Tax=Diaminobutyricimonas sp. TR449 TaxID=2708076 RepID=UPI00141EBB4B|nr:hypothetical protein [Diaminobutyricimonas sp. TR449]
MELVIYAMLAVVVLTIVGGLLINSLRAQALVNNSAQSSNTGQLVAQSATRGVRDAAKLELSTPLPDVQVLRALVIDDALASPVVAHCRAWYFGDGAVRTTRSSVAIPLPTTAADVSNWMLLADGVEKVNADPVVGLVGRSVKLKLQLAQGTESEVLIETTAVSRQPIAVPTEVETLCF